MVPDRGLGGHRDRRCPGRSVTQNPDEPFRFAGGLRRQGWPRMPPTAGPIEGFGPASRIQPIHRIPVDRSLYSVPDPRADSRIHARGAPRCSRSGGGTVKPKFVSAGIRARGQAVGEIVCLHVGSVRSHAAGSRQRAAVSVAAREGGLPGAPPFPISGYGANRPSANTGWPSASIRPPVRRSFTRSQWRAERFVPPHSA